MKQKKSPLKYFHQKLKSFRKSHNMWSVIIISYMHYFFFIFNPLWQTNIVNIEAFLVFPSTCSEWLCVLFGGIFMWANIAWIWNELDGEKGYFIFSKKFWWWWWFFFDILILGSTIIGVRTQQVLQKLDKVE